MPSDNTSPTRDLSSASLPHADENRHGHGQSQRARAIVMLLLANFFWGLSFPLIKSLVLLHSQIAPAAGGWFLTAYVLMPRFLLGLVVLALWDWRGLGDWRWSEWKQGLVLGGFSAAGMVFQCDGMQYTEASTSAFLTQFYAILIPVFVAWRSRKWPTARVWTSCALVLTGVAILGKLDWRAMHLGRGELETIIASVFFMGQILCLERAEFAANRTGKITLVMFAVECLVFGVMSLWLAPDVNALAKPWVSTPWLVMTLVLTLLSTVGSYSIMNAWQPKISATEAGLIYCVEPIFGSLLALFLPGMISAWCGIAYFDETATWTLLIGGGLITAANVLLQTGSTTPAAEKRE